MTAVDWRQEINFASALLLHSCLTVLVKEACNIITLLYRSTLFSKNDSAGASSWQSVRSSAILDAYTSIFSKDEDGELAELYYTNTGALLLASTLAASVAMNLYLSDNVLNGIIVGTFAFCFVASLAVGKGRFTIFIVALRRAGRFIWADTPFVNFFSLIYIATVLHGSPMLRVKDYVAFRSIAVFELLFMKAKLAASSVEQQQIMMKRLIQTGLTILKSAEISSFKLQQMPSISRERVAAFQTYQRLSAMLFKTTVGHQYGSVSGAGGPCTFILPEINYAITDTQRGLRICRLSEQVVIFADFQTSLPEDGWWPRLRSHAHGVLLRRIGRVRVVYLILAAEKLQAGLPIRFHSNLNLVSGVPRAYLDTFQEQIAGNPTLAAVY